MHFDDSYFEDEVREGFYVPSLMKRNWAAQLEVLYDLDKACKKNGIKYWVDWGTLLGAIRHKGIIPWDDDIDISMLREDYIRFVEVGVKDMPSCYSMFGYFNDDNNWQYIHRVMNEKSIKFEEERLIKFHGFPFNVGVDIFVWDDISADEKAKKEFDEDIRLINNVAAALSPDESNVYLYENYLKEIEEKHKVRIDRKKEVKRQLFALNDRYFQKFSGTGCEDIVEITGWINNGDKRIVKKSIVEDLIYVPFEGLEVPIPRNYEPILNLYYGANYMEKIRAWDNHGYPGYDRQLVTLKEKTGHTLKQFKPAPNEILGEGNEKSHVYCSEKLKLELKEYYDTLLAACDYVAKGCGENERISLLTESQNLAIAMGTKIERIYGEGTYMVSLLEKYCEACYVAATDGEKNSFAGLLEILEEIALSLDKFLAGEIVLQDGVTKRKEVVFLTWSPKYWETFDEYYKKETADPDTNVFVIPLPLFSLGCFGETKNSVTVKDGYPSDVVLTDAYEIDIRARHPEKIYCQFPFDSYSFGETCDERYYLSKLREYTDKMIFVSPFDLGDIPDEDYRTKKSLTAFLWSPGVVFADEVHIGENGVKKGVVDILTDAAKEYVTEEKDMPSYMRKLIAKGFKSVWEDKVIK